MILEPPKPPDPKMNRSKWILLCTLMFALICVTIEGICWIGIALMPSMDIRRTVDVFEDQSVKIRQLLNPIGPGMIEIHPVLGWRYAANYKTAVHHLNSKALRSTKEYTPIHPPNVLRIAAFGSSIVYCNEVDNPNAWPTLMEAENPDLEVLNYGVGGYGTDQAYLRYLLEGSDFAPQVVVIGFTPDELRRTVNVYRRFMSTRDLISFKPRYLLDAQGHLSLLEVPMRERADYERLLTNPREVIRFGKHDAWYQSCVYENPLYDYSTTMRLTCWLASEVNRRYLDPDRLFHGEVFNDTSTAFRIQLALFEKFAETVRASNAFPFVVLLPERESVQRGLQGGSKLYDPLLGPLRERGIDYVDAIEAFRSTGVTAEVNSWFASGGHYSPAGNKVVASWLSSEIRKKVASQKQAGNRLQ
jgi:hypothetical protein